MGPYTVKLNPHHRGYDVVRNAPTTVATELKLGEADALAFALNTQVRLIESPAA